MVKVLMHFTDFQHKPERRKHNTFGALGYYRIHKPSQQLGNHTVDVRGTDIVNYGDTFESNWENIFKQYDIIWIMHFLSEQNAAAQAFFNDKYKKKLIYDIDDNYLDVPESNPVHDKFKKTKRDRSILSTSFFFSNALTVSTEPLQARMKDHFKGVHGIDKPCLLVPNMNDVNDWNFTPAKKHDDKVVIGYSGSNSHQDDLKMVLPSINKLLSKYPKLHFEIIGAIDKTKLKDYFGRFDPKNLERVAMLPATATFWEYPEYLAKQKWDIGIAPLVDTAFTRSKSHIKWMEYSMYEIPTVASKVYPYYVDIEGRDTITDDETGYLCEPNEWENKLSRLIEDKTLRERIGKQAKEYIMDTWQYKHRDFNATVDEIMSL